MGLYESIIASGARAAMSEKEFLEQEIARWKASQKRKDQLTGERYYLGKHDIKDRKREIIGAGGELTELKYLPNNKHVDNKYGKQVDTKVNYLLGKPFTIKGDNKNYVKELKNIINKSFYRKFKYIGKRSLNGGIAYLYPYYDTAKDSILRFKVFPSHEILPFWSDREHTELDAFIRLYEVEDYEGKNLSIVEKVEYYTLDGIRYYEFEKGKLVPDAQKENTPYFTVTSKNGDKEEIKSFNWNRIPLIAFKYGEDETPLITNVKSLQDGINIILSNFQNNMEEDVRNTILVVINYGGTDLAELRKNLAEYGAVLIDDDGDLKSLTIKVDAENYKAILQCLKNALIENVKGVDAKDDRFNSDPNQMNIQSMYSDIDLDANDMETEYQAALEQLLWFINMHLYNTGRGDFTNENVEFIFSRDMPINIGEKIDNLKKLVGIISNKTIVTNIPFVDDVDAELKQKKKEDQAGNDPYDNGFSDFDKKDDAE